MAIPTNTVGYWKFNESSGNAADSSGNGFTLTNNSSATYAAGKLNNAMSTNGTSNFTNASVTRFGTDLFTIAFWWKTPNDTTEVIISAGTGTGGLGALTVWTNSTGVKINDTYAGGTILQSDIDINDNAWHHIVLTRDGSDNMKAWIDGTEDVSARTNDTSDWNQSGNFYVHDRAEDNSYIPTASMDNLLWIKGTAWGSSEISSDYNSGSGLEYSSDVTVSIGAALTLSTTAQAPTILIAVGVSAMTSSFTSGVPEIDLVVYPSTRGQKGIMTRYPVAKGLNAGSESQTGRVSNLVRQGITTIPIRLKAGLN